MDWTDEKYVKLFTRDTVTWRSWPWQGRAVLPLLLRAVDNAGILQVGAREPVRSVALMIDVPEDVVKPGLDALLSDGTAEIVNGVLILPKFNEAQESRKTNAQAKREQREKAKAMARTVQAPEVSTQHRQTAADDVLSAADLGRSGHPPSPALPDPVPCPSPDEVATPKKLPAPPLPREPDDPFIGPEAFFAHVQNLRHRDGGVTERYPDSRSLSTWWSEVGMELNGRFNLLEPALARFGANKHWSEANPPWPFAAFMKTWRDYVRR